MSFGITFFPKSKADQTQMSTLNAVQQQQQQQQNWFKIGFMAKGFLFQKYITVSKNHDLS